MATKSDAVTDDVKWVSAEKDYGLALISGKLVCRNPKGKQLASVPKWLKDTELAGQLVAVRDWLSQHEQDCFQTVQMWMLRSLPVPKEVLIEVWEDPAWKSTLTNLVVCGLDAKGNRNQDKAGFLRDIDDKKGIGIVDLDGETQWIKVNQVSIPHPILLDELDDFRELATELNLEQKISQLYRETWQPDEETLGNSSIDQFGRGKFEQLNHVLGLCRRLGYRVKGGSAVCPVWEKGVLVEARYWIGSEYPEAETWTGELIFTDAKERSLPIKEIGPVSYSEGMRMAAAIFAKRVVEKEDGEE